MPDIFTSTNPISSAKSVKNTHIDSKMLASKKVSNFRNEEKDQMINVSENDVHKLDGHNHNILTSYCFYPDHVKFFNKDKEERVVLILRKHWVANISWLIIAFIMFMAPSFLPFLPFLDKLPPRYETMLTLCWYLVTLTFILEKFLGWFFNVNLVTDERIFDVDFHNLMYREITEADLDQIQDVTVEVGGGVGTLFGFGNVLIQTAAERPRIAFSNVPHPDKVAKILRELGVQEEIEKIEGRVR